MGRFDVDGGPSIVIWEVTRACDLACDHCRMEERTEPSPWELSEAEGRKLTDSVVEMGSHVMVLTGGDPLQRDDLYSLIEYGSSRGLRMATIPATTPRLTRRSVRRLKEAGCARMALSLDGPNAEVHDGIRGEPGTFDRVLMAAEWADELELPFQINSVLSAENLDHFDSLRFLVQGLDPAFWEVFFLVPTGDGRSLGFPSPQRTRDLFEKLYETAREADFGVKVTEAPSYRRYCIERVYRRYGLSPDEIISKENGALSRGTVMQNLNNYLDRRKEKPSPSEKPWRGVRTRAWGINSGKGFVFVNRNGEVYPSGFLPQSAGNVRRTPLPEIYQNSSLLRTIRDPDALKGSCGDCAFRGLCGGSRSRAHATGDGMMDEDPLCPFEVGSRS